jgi:hypothetical protein
MCVVISKKQALFRMAFFKKKKKEKRNLRIANGLSLRRQEKSRVELLRQCRSFHSGRLWGIYRHGEPRW